jgi:hypothetical protein
VHTEAGHRTQRQVALDRTVVDAVVVGLFAFYFSVQAGVLVSRDGKAMASVGRNLVQSGSLHRYVPGHPNLWSPYGIGVSLVTAPLWVIQLHVAPHGHAWVTCTNAIITALTGGLLYLCGIELGWRRTVSVIGALIFGLLTMAPLYSTELFSEPGVTLAIIVSLLGLLRWERHAARAPWLVGAGLAMGVLFRSDTYVTVVVPTLSLVPLFVSRDELRATWRRWLPPIAGPLVLVTAWTLAYNAIRFGSVFVTSYGGVGFTNPFLDGVFRQVLSPGKGFFWYNPILLVGLLGVVLLYRRRRNAAIAIVALSVVRVLLYAKWPFPDGSVAWGPRFLLPVCALLALAVGESLSWSRSLASGPRRVVRGVTVALAALSALVTLLSLWVPYEQQHQEFTNPSTLPTSGALAKAEILRRQALTFNTWTYSPLQYALTHLTHASRLGVGFPLWFWRGGYFPPGLVALLAAIAALSFAWWAARRDAPSSTHQPRSLAPRHARSGQDHAAPLGRAPALSHPQLWCADPVSAEN